MASRTDSIPSVKLQRLANNIHTLLKHKNCSASEHLLFTECVGIMDFIPTHLREQLSSERQTRSSSKTPDPGTVRSFREERKKFFDNKRSSPAEPIPKSDGSPRNSLIVTLPVALPQLDCGNLPTRPEQLLLENSINSPIVDERSLIQRNQRTDLSTANQIDHRHSCPPNETNTVLSIDGPPIAGVLDFPRYASEPAALYVGNATAYLQIDDGQRLETPSPSIVSTPAPALQITAERNQRPTTGPRMEPITEELSNVSLEAFSPLFLPGSFSSPYQTNILFQTPARDPPQKPTEPSHMRMVGLRSPGEEHLPLKTVLEKFRAPTASMSNSAVSTTQRSASDHHLSRLTGIRQDLFAAPAPSHMPTKRLKRARSRTMDSDTRQPTRHHTSSSATSSTQVQASLSSQPKDILNMTPEEMTKLISETVAKVVAEAIAPINVRLDALPRGSTPADPNVIPEALKQARLNELASQNRRIEAEIAAVRNNTWVPIEQTPQPRMETTVQPRPYHLRFDPAALPKYTQPEDLESWLAEMQLEVNTFGETVVCPAIYRHCFKSGDPVKSWYTMLGPDRSDELTKGTGCWLRFAAAMREVWSKSIAARQREAEDRCKLSSESFIQYYFEKLKLLQAAFPESAHSTHISRIRARFNDAQADRFIREQQDLVAFSDQCRQYDDHLKLHPVPVQRLNQFAFPSGTSARYKQLQPASLRAATAPPATSAPTTMSIPVRETASAAPPSRQKDSTRQRRPDVRLSTVADRINPATGKSERSFARSDGTLKFLERSCDFCTQMGKENQQHFSFECPLKGTAKTLLANGDSDSDSDLPGVRTTTRTIGKTSYTFSDSSSDSEN
ncbi:hypothetical protein DFH27DRAFT_640476 [Peziza echinospora]|nr:hypothetical protein DFH27DRAFT_640476 [Peziza echinospora]